MFKHNIVHIEIPSADVAATSAFYKSLFDWQITVDEKMHYSMWEPGEGPGGGFSPLGEDVEPGHVLLYIDCEDIDADLIRAETLGAQIVRKKTEIPGIGWFGMFKDPTGNILALFTSMDPGNNK
jgi:predicted enzyme related to lactoylglutathione lyase